MQQKAQLLGIYASKGYTDLASIINHYNTFQAGGNLHQGVGPTKIGYVAPPISSELEGAPITSPAFSTKKVVYGSNEATRARVREKYPVINQVVDSVAKAYDLNPSVINNRVDSEGIIDRIAQLNDEAVEGARDFRHNWQTNDPRRYDFPTNGFRWYGLDDVATLIEQRKVQPINEAWEDEWNENEKGRMVHSASGKTWVDNIGLMGATLKYFRSLVEKDFPGKDDKFYDEGALAYWNRGRTGGKKYMQGPRTDSRYKTFEEGGLVNNKSDWAKAHEVELALQQLGWDNPDNKLHSDYAAKDDKGYYAGYNLKPVTITAKHPIKDIEPDIKADRKYWDDLYQQYLRREEAGKNYMKWAAPLAMSPLIPIAGPTVMNIMSNPLVDATFTADAVRNLPTAFGDIKDSFDKGKIGRGLLQTGETTLDLLGAGKLGKTFNKAWQKTFDLNTNLGITNNIIPITRPISKNPILNYNPESLPSELKHPFFLAHTLTGKNLAKALKEGSPAPSIGIIRGNNGKPSFTYPIYADDGIYTFYFKPDYLNSKEYVATPFDMFSPTIGNAETYIGRELSPTEVVNAKRDMYNRWGTLNDLQNTVNFSSKLIEDQKQFDKAVRKSQQFKSLQDVKNKMVLGSNEVYGEMMPLDLIDLEKAALVVGGGSKNSDIANFLTNMNFYELYKPHKIDNFYDIPGLAFQKGGKLGKVTPYGQWQYPHQVTTIPSNNITMKGVDYPVIGVSDTGDTKYMLPNMDYLFDGQYVTEYPVNK